MSHTNVDSNKTNHVINSTIIYIDEREEKIEDPVGGINNRGKNVQNDFLEIPLNSEYRLKDDDGTTLYKTNSLEDAKAKQAELQQKRATKITSKNEDVIK